MRMPRLVNEEDSEIVLEVATGDTVLGRGPLLKVLADQTLLHQSTTLWAWHFLQITDKRVSRNHASLEWKNGNLRLCPVSLLLLYVPLLTLLSAETPQPMLPEVCWRVPVFPTH